MRNMSMTVQQQIDIAVTEYNKQVAILQKIMLDPNHVNGESEECLQAINRILFAIKLVFRVKGVHGDISTYANN